MSSSEKEKIKVAVEDILNKRGIELIEFKIFLSSGRDIVRCLIDYPRGGIVLDECAAVNKEIVSFLETSGILGENFIVEVNSPGLDRKLKSYKDFLRVKGREVCLWFNSPFEGKEYFEGELIDLNADEIFLKNKGDIFKISFNLIKVGRVKLT